MDISAQNHGLLIFQMDASDDRPTGGSIDKVDYYSREVPREKLCLFETKKKYRFFSSSGIICKSNFYYFPR